MRHKFIIGGRANSALIKNSIKEVSDKIKDFSNYNIEHNIYCFTKESRWKYEYKNKKGEKTSENRLLYIHVYYDGIRAEFEKKDFIKKLKLIEEAFINGSCSEAQKNLFDKYFTLKENNKNSAVSFTYNQEAINSHIENLGYFVLLSNHITNPNIAISIYRTINEQIYSH